MDRVYFWIALLFFPLLTWGEANTVRVWTSADGEATFRGTWRAFDGDQVLIQREADGLEFLVDPAALSSADREWLEELRVSRQAEAESPSPDPPATMEWPRRIRVGPDYEIEVVEENRAENRFVYRSNHFEFVSDRALARRVVREFGQIFEGTYLAIQAMPLKWNPQPSKADHFVVQLFAERSDYYAAGGLPNSGGVYRSDLRECLVPFSSIGLERISSTYGLTGNSRTGILVHEVTHQVHHHWLRHLPVWLVEGLAVYMQSVPYERGVFRFDQQDVRTYFLQRSRQSLEFIDLQSMFSLTSIEWNRQLTSQDPRASLNYATAFLMANYFFHLDDGGAPMYRYLRAVEGGMAHQDALTYLLADRSVEELQNEFIRAYQRNGLRLSPRES